MSPNSLQGDVRAAIRAALAAGALLRQFVGRPRTVKTKRSAADLVTEVDRAAERLIARLLRRADPTIGFLGEELGRRRERASSRWIVDPIDGTNNFVHGFPCFAVSIALEVRGTVVVGVIYDPMRRELFVASQGAGASLNGRPIRVSQTTRLTQSLLSTGFPVQFRHAARPYLGRFESFERRSHGVRRIGSTTISLASIAAGRMEGFYEQRLWPWDIAAGILLVQEAGGRVSNFRGEPPTLTEGRLVASNGRIHRQMLQLIAGAHLLRRGR
ncbi:MAG: inositol monophosphatase family protein [Candidatus Omnitrophota bacterium]|nr:inositol monophosphatase family protein [Candidatus Omnitrophota bacterium]